MVISIIGGAGFVGTNLCRRLDKQNRNFEIVDLKPSTQFPEKSKFGDVRDIKSLRNSVSGDIVVNLAAIHRDDVVDDRDYWQTNVGGARNIVTLCNEQGINQIIFTSTVAVYGFAKSTTSEIGAINPFNEYGKTKFEAEEIFRAWHGEIGKKLIIVRPTVIFGEGNRGNVYNLMKLIENNKFLMVGNGENKKSMAYIGNVVAFLDRCITTNLKYGLFNYVDGPSMSMNEFVSLIRSQLKGKNGVGLRLPYWFGVFLGHAADIVSLISQKKLPLSSIRIKKFTSSTEFVGNSKNLDGFAPPFELRDAIEKTLNNEFLSPDQDREIFYTE